jgi:chromosome segregation ATPase
MTDTPSESRLDRLEALAETVLLAIQQQGTQIADLRESIAQQGAQITEVSGGIAEVVAMLSEQAEQQDARQAESDQRFENLLQDARADRQRIDEALARGDRDRALNESEHRAFRETFQTLLAEVARIWQQLKIGGGQTVDALNPEIKGEC